MKKGDYILVIGLFFSTALLVGDSPEIQKVAVRRLAATRGIELSPAKSRSGRRPSVFQGLFNIIGGSIAPVPVVQDATFKSLKARLDKEKNLVGDNYYTVYVSVPRKMILTYFFLEQLEGYFEKQNYPYPNKIVSLISYFAQQNAGRQVRVELDLENIFQPKEKSPVLMRQRVFGPVEKFTAQDWSMLKPYVQAKTLEDLAAFLNQYIDNTEYDENILVELFIPKGRANNIIKVKAFGRDIALDDLTKTDAGFDNDAFAILTLQARQKYDDVKTVVVHSLKNAFSSNSDLQEQFAPMVEIVGAQMLASLKNPPVPVARPVGTAPFTTPAPPPVPRDVKPPVVEGGSGPLESRPKPKLDILKEIRAGRELRKTDTKAESGFVGNPLVGILSGAIRGERTSGDVTTSDEENDPDWLEEPVVAPQRPAVQSQSQPSLPQMASPRQSSPSAGQPINIPSGASGRPIMQEDLQANLTSALEKRRAATGDDEGSGDVEDWDDEE